MKIERNEVERFKEVINSSGEIRYFVDNDREVVENLLSNLKIFSFERPDIVLENDEFIVLVEHFQIDASKYISSKGNKDKVESFKRQQKFDEFAKKSSDPSVSLSMNIEVEYRKENYIDNLIRCFNDHYLKIDSYIEAINQIERNNNKEFKVAFYIEDTNPVGAYWLGKGNIEPLVIFQIDEFLKLLKKSPKVDYIFYSNYCHTKYHMNFLSTKFSNQINIEQYNLNDKVFFCFDPKEIAFRQVIPE